MQPYRPTLTKRPDGSVEQSFTANVVHVGDDLIAFGDLIPDPQKGLPYGTTVHSLLVHLGDSGPEMLEFNNQGNSAPVDAIQGTELARDHARFSFRDASGLFAGRVPLSDEEEVFEDVSPDDETQLTTICVRFEVDDIRFEALREGLAPLLSRHTRD